VIKIRYSDLPSGLHVRADIQGRNTILYLLPGLTAAQRKAAIRRARSAARVGHGPGLPASGVARALAADRIRTTVTNGLAAMRMHPAIFFPPLIIIAASAVAYLLLVSVSVRFIPPDSSGSRVSVGFGHGGSVPPPGGRNGRGAPPASGAAPGSPGSPGTAPPGRSPGSPATPTPSPSGVLPSPGQPGSPSPAPSATPPSTPAPAPTPSPSTSPSPGTGSAGGGVCVKVGLFGVCVGL